MYQRTHTRGSGRQTTIMHHPLPNPHREGVVLRHFQIIHRLRARNHFPTCHHPVLPIGFQHMHAQRNLSDRQEALFLRQEGVLLIGVDDLDGLVRVFTMRVGFGNRQGEVYQVVVMVDPHVQDRLEFHAVRLGIVRPHLVAYVQGAYRLLTMRRCHQGRGIKAERATAFFQSPLVGSQAEAYIRNITPAHPLLGCH